MNGRSTINGSVLIQLVNTFYDPFKRTNEKNQECFMKHLTPSEYVNKQDRKLERQTDGQGWRDKMDKQQK